MAEMDGLGELMSASGIGLWGVCALDRLPPFLPCRAADRLPAGAGAVIVCLFPYYTGEFPRRNVARYAVAGDYHQVAGDMLRAASGRLEAAFPREAAAYFVDNSPLREVEAARLAGLGVVGRNGQLIHPVYGSRVFIGAIVTTLPLTPSLPMDGGCLSCGSCAAACPTGALQGGRLDAARCRSQITQKKGTLTPWEEEQIRLGGMAWGCDCCLDACPINREKPLSPIEAFYHNPAPLLTAENLDSLLGGRAYGYRGKRVLLRNLSII